MKNREEKRNKVLGAEGTKNETGPQAKRLAWYLAAGLVVAVAVGIGLQGGLQSRPGGVATGAGGTGQTRREASAVKVAAVDYSGRRLEQTGVQVVVSGGKIRIPLAEIERYKLVSFEYDGPNQSGESTVPLLAYVAPSGKVVTAIRLCEPCSSTSFHIAGPNLVCNTCGTVWSLENLKGLSGGCQKYPPAAMTTSRDGSDAIMNVDEVSAWKPRV